MFAVFADTTAMRSPSRRLSAIELCWHVLSVMDTRTLSHSVNLLTEDAAMAARAPSPVSYAIQVSD